MLARNGKTPTEIGKILTDERTLVPSEIVGNGHTRKDGIKEVGIEIQLKEYCKM